jgi:hypothetical protein
MKHTNISISACKTYQDCDKAIDAIENDPKNVQGGMRAWTSGYETHLLVGAQNKVDALQKKSNKLADKVIEDSGEW